MEAGGPAIAAGLRCHGLAVAPGGATVLHDVDLEVAAGSLTVLVGPSGAGKTTLLRAIAGLEDVAAGTIELGGRDLAGVATHERAIAVVFQEPRLFPSLDVADNVSFALRMGGMPATERRAVAAGLLEDVGLGGFDNRSVRHLSGGEQQRVGLARALAGNPELLLLDEPLAAVDPNRRDDLRRLVRRLQRERAVTAVYITHDRADAAELGDRVAVMIEGRIIQHARPDELFERPRSAVVARFFGSSNLLTGIVRDGRLPVGPASIEVPGPDGPATVTIRPEQVVLDADGPLELTVRECAYHGSYVRLLLADHGGSGLAIEAHAAPATAPSLDQSVRVTLPAASLWRLPEPDESAVDAAPPDVGHRAGHATGRLARRRGNRQPIDARSTHEPS